MFTLKFSYLDIVFMRWDGRFTSADHCLDTNTGTAAAYKPLTSMPSWIRRAAQQENTAGSPNRWLFLISYLHGHTLYNQETTYNPFWNLYVVCVWSAGQKEGGLQAWLAPDRKAGRGHNLRQELQSRAFVCGGKPHGGELRSTFKISHHISIQWLL